MTNESFSPWFESPSGKKNSCSFTQSFPPFNTETKRCAINSTKYFIFAYRQKYIIVEEGVV